jgi:hypothetical protein
MNASVSAERQAALDALQECLVFGAKRRPALCTEVCAAAHRRARLGIIIFARAHVVAIQDTFWRHERAERSGDIVASRAPGISRAIAVRSVVQMYGRSAVQALDAQLQHAATLRRQGSRNAARSQRAMHYRRAERSESVRLLQHCSETLVRQLPRAADVQARQQAARARHKRLEPLVCQVFSTRCVRQ